MNPTDDRQQSQHRPDDPIHGSDTIGGDTIDAPFDEVSRVRAERPRVPVGAETLDLGPQRQIGSPLASDTDEDLRVVRTREAASDDVEHTRNQATKPDVIEELAQPDNRAKLLLAIALMSLVTLILTLVIAIDVLAEADEPVVVDGIPCLVEDGEGDNAILYCQR